ncbi:hypothetical protein IQ243_05765 [Nostocales cyanobacterium LEGE 11386]|nr:hypothetical protein [Nostocales cyanobacterium LEGE 11386]
MINLISRAITHISFLMKGIQLKRFLSIVLVGFLVLTTNVAPEYNNKALREKVDAQIHQDDSQRPKTTGEWHEEARETEGSPVKRLQKIGEESAEAFKEFGSGYVEGAKETARDLQNK